MREPTWAGFNADTSRVLLLRWLALGVFTPLMRATTRAATPAGRSSTSLRAPKTSAASSRPATGFDPLILYSEYMKAALNGDMLFKPLAFVYPEDESRPSDRGPADAGQ